MGRRAAALLARPARLWYTAIVEIIAADRSSPESTPRTSSRAGAPAAASPGQRAGRARIAPGKANAAADALGGTLASCVAQRAQSPPGSTLWRTPTLAEILTDYQVADDATAEWSPSAGGLIPIPFAPSRVLTVTEGRLLDNLTRDRGLLGLSEFSDIKDEAFAVSERQYPTPTTFPAHAPTERRARNAWVQNNGHRDAFRHCYWNAILTDEFGASWTRQFATAHEALPGNEAAREAMDLYNNEVGRAIAGSKPWWAGRSWLATRVRQAVDSGRLVVVDRSGNLAWSNTVALWDHGDVANVTLPGAIAVPAGTASAN